MRYQSSLVSPERGAGAGVGAGMLRGRELSLLKIKQFQSLKSSCFFVGVVGFLVPWFLGFLVSTFQDSKVKFHVF